MRTKKVAKKKQQSLAERIEKLRAECDAFLDSEAEKVRHSSIPAPTIRQLWMAKAGGNLFEATLLASKEGK